MMKSGNKPHGWKLCVGVLWMMVAVITVLSRAQTPDINLTVYRDLVRFTAPGEARAWRVEVFSPFGEKLFDSDFVTGQALDWPLSNQSGQPLEGGLYAYTITIRNVLGNVSRVYQQGNMIIDQAREDLEMAPPLNYGTIQTTSTDGSDSEGAEARPSSKTSDPTIPGSGPVVTRLNGLFNKVNLAAGSGIAISTSLPTNTLTISATGGGGGGGVTAVTASAPLASSGGATPNLSLTGIVAAANGGTGLSSAGASGNYLRSNGSSWTRSAILAADLPDLGNSYIRNTTTRQASSNFNISGNGTLGGVLSANIVNALAQYNLNGVRVLSNAGTQNLFAGAAAGSINTGSFNAFFGSTAGSVNTTGGDNAFFGAIAGAANTTGSFNSFFGSRAGVSNTMGNANAFFGRNAGAANTTGSSNAFFGNSAGGRNTTGGFNAFFGALAGFSNTTGFNNNFFGFEAGENNTTGSNNAFFGYRSGQANTAGGSNAFFGDGAGGRNTTGSSNAFFGQVAGSSNTIGDANAFFGYGAGGRNTMGAGNTFVGFDAGLSNTTENNNTFIGIFANGAAGITNATAIGARASVTVSNALVLGSGANVGIGTTAPKSKLHIVGGDAFIATPNSLIITSPNGSCWQIRANDSGVLFAVSVSCPK